MEATETSAAAQFVSFEGFVLEVGNESLKYAPRCIKPSGPPSFTYFVISGSLMNYDQLKYGHSYNIILSKTGFKAIPAEQGFLSDKGNGLSIQKEADGGLYSFWLVNVDDEKSEKVVKHGESAYIKCIETNYFLSATPSEDGYSSVIQRIHKGDVKLTKEDNPWEIFQIKLANFKPATSTPKQTRKAWKDPFNLSLFNAIKPNVSNILYDGERDDSTRKGVKVDLYKLSYFPMDGGGEINLVGDPSDTEVNRGTMMVTISFSIYNFNFLSEAEISNLKKWYGKPEDADLPLRLNGISFAIYFEYNKSTRRLGVFSDDDIVLDKNRAVVPSFEYDAIYLDEVPNVIFGLEPISQGSAPNISGPAITGGQQHGIRFRAKFDGITIVARDIFPREVV